MTGLLLGVLNILTGKQVKLNAYLVFVLMFVSLFTPGLIRFEFFELRSTSWDVATLLALPPAFLVWRSVDYRTDYLPKSLIIVVTILFVWYLVAGFRHASDDRSWTIVAMYLRGLLMAALIVLAGNTMGLKGVVRTLFWTGVVFSSLALLLYLFNAGDYPWSDRRPYGNLILMFDEFQTTRIIGLAQDPNFLTIPTLFAIAIGLLFPKGWRRRTVHGIAVMIMSLVVLLTVSRSGIAGSVVGVMLAMVAVYIAGSVRIRQSTLSSAGLFLLILIIVVITGIRLTTAFSGVSVVAQLSNRFEQTTQSPRFKIWGNILALRFSDDEPVATASVVPDAIVSIKPTASVAPAVTVSVEPTSSVVPDATVGVVSTPTVVAVPTVEQRSGKLLQTIIGDGNASNVRNQKVHSHNSYLDIWIELGLIGALLWLAVAAVVVNQLRKAFPLTSVDQTRLFALGVAGSSMIGVMMFSSTLMSLPYLFVVLGLVMLIHTETQERSIDTA
jgi:hypothetical protein